MSSEFLRCNYLELIYCKKRGTSDLLSPPFTPQKSVKKNDSNKTKKKRSKFGEHPPFGVYFCFLHILPSSTTRKMCFMLNVCPPLRHCDDGNGGSMWQCFFFGSPTVGWSTKNFEKKRKSVSSHLPPFHQFKK